MKTILRTIIFAPIIAVTLISCHKDLVVIQKGTVTAQEAWLTPEDAEANMYGMIDKLRVAFYNRLVHWGEYRAGIWEPGLTNNIEILNIFENTISSANPHTDWTEIYSALNIANTVLKYAPTVDYTGQEAVMNRVIGSAYFTRAFCNYWIVRIWGDAPLQTIAIETTDPDILYPQRASKADIYAQVAADLESAAEHLKGTDIAPNMPNLNAVNTLKADLYLWLYKVEKDSSALAKARAAVNDVIGKRVLLENYADIFNVNNNFYGMGGQTRGETMGFDMVARLGAGFNPSQMHAERVNGYDPLAVIDAVSRKKKLLLEGKGPALLDVVTYRVSGHSPSDSSTYRTAEEIEAWKAADPILAFKNKLVKGKIATENEIATMHEEITARMTEIMKLAINDEISPRMDLEKEPDAIASIMFSNQKVKSMDPSREADVMMPKEECPRVKEIKGSEGLAALANYLMERNC